MFVRATFALTSIARTITALILLLSLAQCSFGGGFFPNFAIFALVLDHLRNFSFYSWASLLVLPFLLHLPILLSISPKVTSLGGFSWQPAFSGGPCFCVWRFFFSVAAVLCLLLPPPAGGHIGYC